MLRPKHLPGRQSLKAATVRASADRKKLCTEGLRSLRLRRASGAAEPRFRPGRGRDRPDPSGPVRGRRGAGGVASRMLSSRAVRVAGLGRRRKHREPPHGAGGERRPGGRGAAGRECGPVVRALALGPSAPVAGDGRGRPLPAPVARALQVSARGARARRGGRAHGRGWRGGVPGPRVSPGAGKDRVESAGVAAVIRAPPWGLSSSRDTCASF